VCVDQQKSLLSSHLSGSSRTVSLESDIWMNLRIAYAENVEDRTVEPRNR